MYNDYYLNEINQNLVFTNSYLDDIYQNQNTIISNQETISFNLLHGFVWVVILLFALIFYGYFSHIFRRK